MIETLCIFPKISIFKSCPTFARSGLTIPNIKDLPILIIDSFDELNIENLKSQYESVSKKMNDSGIDKAKFSYWKNEISQAVRALNE